jgi:hypothetical protein
MGGLSSDVRSFLVLGAKGARRRSIITLVSGAVLLAGPPAMAQKKYDPGASDTEIKIGQTHSYSGPASSFSISARVALAYYDAERPWRHQRAEDHDDLAG